MNGWTEDGAQFMTDLCMNQGLDCGTTVPYAYSKAEENTWVSSEDDKPHASVDTLYVQDDWTNGGRTQHPETLTLVKFKIPPLPANMDASLFKYRIRLFGGKTETNGADQIFFYPTSSDWHVSTVSWNNKPAINYRSDAVLYLDHSHEYRMVDVDKAVRKALAEGKTEISWYIGGDRQGNHYDFTPADSKQSLVLMLTGFKRRRSCNSKLCPLTQQRARWRHKYYGTPSKPDQYLRKTTVYSQAVVPVAAEHPADNRSLRRQAGHRRR